MYPGKIQPTLYIMCGDKDCATWAALNSVRMREAEHEARYAGWRKRDGLWLCPEHSGATAREETSSLVTIGDLCAQLEADKAVTP